MKYRIAHNPNEHKVAGPWLQLQYGCESEIAHKFPYEVWTLEESEYMIVEDLEEFELEDLIQRLSQVDTIEPAK